MMTPLADRFESTKGRQLFWNAKFSQVQFIHFVTQIAERREHFASIAQAVAQLLYNSLPKDVESVLIHADSLEGYFARFPLAGSSGTQHLRMLGRRFGIRVVLELERLFLREQIPVTQYSLNSALMQVDFRFLSHGASLIRFSRSWKRGVHINEIAHMICQTINDSFHAVDFDVRSFVPGVSGKNARPHTQSCTSRAIVNFWAKGADKYEDFIWEWEGRLHQVVRILRKRNFKMFIVVPDRTNLKLKDFIRWERVKRSLIVQYDPFIQLIPVDQNLARRVLRSDLVFTHDTGLAHLAQLLGKKTIVMHGRRSKRHWIAGFQNRVRLVPELTMRNFGRNVERKIAGVQNEI